MQLDMTPCNWTPGFWFNWSGSTNSGVTNRFQVSRCTNLLEQSWQVVASNLARSGTGTNLWSDTNAFNLLPRAFYRITTLSQ